MSTVVALSDTLATFVRALEEEIVLGLRHPKERLIEDDLMAHYGLRRHQVRAGLAELVRMGLVEHRKNVGALVRSYERSEVMDLYDMRELLEGRAAALMACPAPHADIQRLQALQQAHDEAVAAQDARAIFRANMAFHTALFALCPNKALVACLHDFARQTHAIRFSAARSAPAQARARAEHRAIIDALAAGDKEELVRLCKIHITPSRDEYLAARTPVAVQPLAGDLEKIM
jgi:DNA-binding GntR family transcriptional regulator